MIRKLMNFLKKWWSKRHLEQTQVKDEVCVETRTKASPANETTLDKAGKIPQEEL